MGCLSGTDLSFSAYPSITDPCNNRSSDSGGSSWQQSGFPSYGPTSGGRTEGSGGGFLSEVNPILGGAYGIGRAFNAPWAALDNDEDKYPGQPTGEKIGVVGFFVAAAPVGVSAPEAGLLLVGYYVLRGFVSVCQAASFCVNGPSFKIINESFAPKGEYPTSGPKENSRSNSRGVNNSTVKEAIKKGQEAHKNLSNAIKETAPEGWIPEKTLDGLDGKKYRVDVMTSKGTFLELKPDTKSGRAAGERQKATYEKNLVMQGEVITYDDTGKPNYDLQSLYNK